MELDSCGCTQVWSGHSKDRCEVDTTVDSCGVDATVDSCGVDAIIPAVHACSVTFYNTYLLRFQNVPGPCILTTFPMYVNCTTGPDLPKSVRDRASNDIYNCSGCFKQ